MIGDIVGYATISKNPSPDTTVYPFGPLTDLAGKTIGVLERNKYGDCLCAVGGGIADVSAVDIVKYVEAG